MEEKKITSAAAAEETIASIKKLLEAVGNDDELKQKLEDTLAALTGKTKTPESPALSEDDSNNVDSEEDDDEEEEEDISCNDSSGTDFSDIFTEDAIAGMVVGFVAGAAVVGGGVLLHKLLK
jgi:hypothetical protein